MRRVARVLGRTARSFYDDQLTHHAAAMTYYVLMSLFPLLLVALSLLGLLGEYPRTYNALLGHLRHVVPAPTLDTVDRSLRGALRHKGTASTALAFSAVAALYGSTGALEATRRALNVVFEVSSGRSFLRRKAIDVVSSIALVVLVVISLIAVFLGGSAADEVFRSIGAAGTARDVWAVARWPAAIAVAMLIFSGIYYVTPDVKQRSFVLITPGAAIGVLVWLGVTFAFSQYLSHFPAAGAVYGAFAAAIFLIVWLWLTNVALLFGAELDAEIERERQMAEGVPEADTLNLPART
jgi:membrane protein